MHGQHARVYVEVLEMDSEGLVVPGIDVDIVAGENVGMHYKHKLVEEQKVREESHVRLYHVLHYLSPIYIFVFLLSVKTCRLFVQQNCVCFIIFTSKVNLVEIKVYLLELVILTLSDTSLA